MSFVVKSIWLALFLCLNLSPLFAQFEGEYDRLVIEGTDSLQAGNYQFAILKFQSAGRADPNRSKLADSLILIAFDRIRTQRDMADSAFVEADSAKKVAEVNAYRARRLLRRAKTAETDLEKSLAETQIALAKAERLVTYFFDDTLEALAWAYGPNGKFGVVDRDGHLHPDGFVWEEPDKFSQGLSTAKRGGEYFFIGDTGQAVSEGYTWMHPSDRQQYAVVRQRNGFFEYRVLDTNRLAIIEGTGTIFRSPEDGSTLPYFSPRAGGYQLVDYLGTLLNEQVFDTIWPWNEGLAIVSQAGRWGALDQQGKAIIPVQYDSILPFSEGLAAIQAMDTKQWGFVNPQGTLTIAPQYTKVKSFAGGHAWVSDTLTDRAFNGYWGLINQQGKTVLPIIRRQIIKDASEGLVWSYTYEEQGFVLEDTLGKRVASPRYDKADSFVEGKALVQLENDKVTYVGRDGETLLPAKYERLGPYENGYIRFQKRSGRWGVMDSLGQVVIKPRYHQINASSAGLYRVMKKDKWGLIDPKGALLVKPIYAEIGPFFDQIAYFQTLRGSWGYLDKSGTVVHPPNLDILYRWTGNYCRIRAGKYYGYLNSQGEPISVFRYMQAEDFTMGLARVSMGGNEPFHFIDTTGKSVLPTMVEDYLPMSETTVRIREKGEYKYVRAGGKILLRRIYNDMRQAGSNLIWLKQGKEESIANQEGRIIIPAGRYDEIGGFFSGYAQVKKEGRWGLVDSTGREVIPPKYNGVQHDSASPIWTLMVDDEFRDPDGSTPHFAQRFQYLTHTGEIAFSLDESIETAFPFSEGRARILSQSGEGFLNTLGEIVIPAIYEAVADFSDGLAAVKDKDGTLLYVDLKGNVQLRLPYEFNPEKPMQFEAGIARVFQNGKVGLINQQGDLILPLAYVEIERAADQGLFYLRQAPDELFALAVLKDQRLEVITKPIFEDIWERGGLLYGQQKGRVGLYTLRGKQILPPDYDLIRPVGPRAYQLTQSGRVGLLVFTTPVTAGKTPPTIDFRLPCEFEEIAGNYLDEMIPTKQGGKWGYYRRIPGRGGEAVVAQVIPHRYEAVTPFYGQAGVRYARVSQVLFQDERKAFFINEKGELLLRLGPMQN